MRSGSSVSVGSDLGRAPGNNVRMAVRWLARAFRGWPASRLWCGLAVGMMGGALAAQAGTAFGVDTSLAAPEAETLLRQLDAEDAVRAAPLRIRRLALLFTAQPDGRWQPTDAAQLAQVKDALGLLRARGHAIVALADIDLVKWGRGTRQGVVARRMPTDLRELSALAATLREHFDELVDWWEVGNEPEIFLFDNAEDYAAALKAFHWGYLQAPGDPQAQVLMAPLAYPPGTYLQGLLANDLLRHTQGWNFHLYGFAEDIGPAYDQHLRALRHMSAQAPSALSGTRRKLPVYLTEVGYAGMDSGSAATPEARARQQRWFARARADLERRRPVMALAFVLKPYVSPLGREMGLVTRSEGGFLATEALLTWTRASTSRRSPRPVTVPAFAAAGPLVMDFIPGGTFRQLQDRSGYLLGAGPLSGTLAIYNFSAAPVLARVTGDFFPGEARELLVSPGGRLALPASVALPTGAERGVVAMTLAYEGLEAHWSTRLLRVPGETIRPPVFTFTETENGRARQRELRRIPAREEPAFASHGRWLVTEGTTVEESPEGWRITVTRLPALPANRRAIVELPLPRGVTPAAGSWLKFAYRVEGGGGRCGIDVHWRTDAGALFGAVPLFIANGTPADFVRPLDDFSQSFFGRVARDWRVERQSFRTLVLALRPFGELPMTVVIRDPRIEEAR